MQTSLATTAPVGTNGAAPVVTRPRNAAVVGTTRFIPRTGQPHADRPPVRSRSADAHRSLGFNAVDVSRPTIHHRLVKLPSTDWGRPTGGSPTGSATVRSRKARQVVATGCDP